MTPSSSNVYQTSRGFTLIELMVAISIITVLSGVVLWNQSIAVQQVALSNAVQEISVRIREAQIYGVGVRVVEDGSGGTFEVSYGIHVDNGGGDILLFADKDASETYSGTSACVLGVSEECLDKFTFTNGIIISDICGEWGGSERCASSFAGLESLDILFRRPNPRANPQFLNNGGNAFSQFTDSYAKIKIENNLGDCRMIKVYETGQLTTNESCSA